MTPKEQSITVRFQIINNQFIKLRAYATDVEAVEPGTAAKLEALRQQVKELGAVMAKSCRGKK